MDKEGTASDAGGKQGGLGKIDEGFEKSSDRIAESQPDKNGRSWTDIISRWSAYLAFAVFFFGAGSFTDFKDAFLQKNHTDQAAHQHDLAVYFTTLNNKCSSGPFPTTASGLRGEAKEQDALINTWLSINDDKLSKTEKNDMGTALDHLVDAEQSLLSMATDLDQNNIASYNIQLGEYRQDITAMNALVRPLTPIGGSLSICTIPPYTLPIE
ncbi:hypothetical protein [Nocardia miyunensis]|uniref:hypothetical protein n=1 Tax=Nocardia miyunensis TaxID=282684 RepID=UPI0012F4B1A0|nr:hypothetical protein [Nocardia miyunensis]